VGNVRAPIIVVAGPSGAGKTTVGRMVAAAFDPSAHVRMDHFTAFVVNGRVDPWLPESGHQNHVVGGAAAAAAIGLAEGGYTVVLDGHVFPDGLEGLREVCRLRGVPLHYAVLRPDLPTCLARVSQRELGEPDDPGLHARLHARYTDLGGYEANVIEGPGAPADVAGAILAAVAAGQLVAEPTAPAVPRPTPR